LSEGARDPADLQEFLRRDMAAIKDMSNTLRHSRQPGGAASETNGGSILTVAQTDLSRLVAVRLAHQTKRAANSVKTHVNSQDTTVGPPAQTDRQRLCAQMAEVVRRAGSGLERGAQWRSGTAPGTRSLAETLVLTGNSANAEAVAKERVTAVCNLQLPDESDASSHENMQARVTRADHFNKGNINFSQYLADGLVGDGENPAPPLHVPLKAGDWAFIYWDGSIYVGRGIFQP
jgi:hypothetical protein